MPVDLKWVRQDPQGVKEWQRLRLGGEDDDDGYSEFLVRDVLQKDETSRRYLRRLDAERRRRKEVQRPRQSRPATLNKYGQNTTIEKKVGIWDEDDPPTMAGREGGSSQKKEIDLEISRLEGLWKASRKETERALNRLSSPVDLVQGRVQEASSAVNLGGPKDADSIPWDDDAAPAGFTRRALDLEQAFYRCTHLRFARYSSWVHFATPGLAVRGESSPQSESNVGSVSPDRAHALWGCLDRSMVNGGGGSDSVVGGMDLNGKSHSSTSVSSSCPICRADVSSEGGARSTVLLPTWMRILLEYLPAKSIWGDRQLPVYSAVWSKNVPRGCGHIDKAQQSDVCWLGDTITSSMSKTPAPGSFASFSLDLVALTASSAVDARQVQADLVQELLGFYECLLIPVTRHDSSSMVCWRLRIRRAPHSQLHPHEWSRQEILMERVVIPCDRGNGDDGASSDRASSSSEGRHCLGSVSHWGDAASRACGMAFAGGGHNGAVTSPGTATKDFVHVVQASVVDASTWNKILHANRRRCSLNGEILVGVPPFLTCHLMDTVRVSQTGSLRGMAATGKKGVVWHAWKDLVVPNMSGTKKNMKQSVFRPLETNHKTLLQNQAASPATKQRANAEASFIPLSREPKFPLLSTLSNPDQTNDHSIVWGEDLSCPFDFLL
jgi:hypothetical protein